MRRRLAAAPPRAPPASCLGPCWLALTGLVLAPSPALLQAVHLPRFTLLGDLGSFWVTSGCCWLLALGLFSSRDGCWQLKEGCWLQAGCWLHREAPDERVYRQPALLNRLRSPSFSLRTQPGGLYASALHPEHGSCKSNATCFLLAVSTSAPQTALQRINQMLSP